jgi:hypothetical protein
VPLSVLVGYPLDQQPVLFDRPREREWRRMTKYLLRGSDPLTSSHQIFCFCFAFVFLLFFEHEWPSYPNLSF